MRDQRTCCDSIQLRRVSRDVIGREQRDSRRTHREDDGPRRTDLSGRPLVSRDARQGETWIQTCTDEIEMERARVRTPMG